MSFSANVPFNNFFLRSRTPVSLNYQPLAVTTHVSPLNVGSVSILNIKNYNDIINHSYNLLQLKIILINNKQCKAIIIINK